MKKIIVPLLASMIFIAGCVELSPERFNEYISDPAIVEQIINISESLCFNITALYENESTEYLIKAYDCRITEQVVASIKDSSIITIN